MKSILSKRTTLIAIFMISFFLATINFNGVFSQNDKSEEPSKYDSLSYSEQAGKSCPECSIKDTSLCPDSVYSNPDEVAATRPSMKDGSIAGSGSDSSRTDLNLKNPSSTTEEAKSPNKNSTSGNSNSSSSGFSTETKTSTSNQGCPVLNEDDQCPGN